MVNGLVILSHCNHSAIMDEQFDCLILGTLATAYVRTYTSKVSFDTITFKEEHIENRFI